MVREPAIGLVPQLQPREEVVTLAGPNVAPGTSRARIDDVLVGGRGRMKLRGGPVVGCLAAGGVVQRFEGSRAAALHPEPFDGRVVDEQPSLRIVSDLEAPHDLTTRAVFHAAPKAIEGPDLLVDRLEADDVAALDVDPVDTCMVHDNTPPVVFVLRLHPTDVLVHGTLREVGLPCAFLPSKRGLRAVGTVQLDAVQRRVVPDAQPFVHPQLDALDHGVRVRALELVQLTRTVLTVLDSDHVVAHG
eukprot:334383_1